jgi:hypothetical protein
LYVGLTPGHVQLTSVPSPVTYRSHPLTYGSRPVTSHHVFLTSAHVRLTPRHTSVHALSRTTHICSHTAHVQSHPLLYTLTHIRAVVTLETHARKAITSSLRQCYNSSCDIVVEVTVVKLKNGDFIMYSFNKFTVYLQTYCSTICLSCSTHVSRLYHTPKNNNIHFWLTSSHQAFTFVSRSLMSLPQYHNNSCDTKKLPGSVYSRPAHVHSRTGHVCSRLAHFHSCPAHVHSRPGHVHSRPGHVHSRRAHVHSRIGHVCSRTGHFQLTSVHARSCPLMSNSLLVTSPITSTHAYAQSY